MLKRTRIKEYAIELEKSNQPPYRLIYSPGLVKLKTLKIYIETNRADAFIQPLKSSTDVAIFFVHKSNGSFSSWVDYFRLNNFTIKSWYLLPPIWESLDWLGQAKQFIRLDLTSAYY